MIKYTRSLQKLTACIQDIFDFEGISIDTKAIVLVLAATMSTSKFNTFIDSIAKLVGINARLKEVNDLRIKCGDLFRDYIILQTLQYLPRDITSDELQQFIRVASHPSDQQLSPALSTQHLEQKLDRASLGSLIQKAAAYLIAKLDLNHASKMETITAAYLHCRDKEKPLSAYYALIYAMADILETSGLDAKNSLLYSNKLAKTALEQFIQDGKKEKTMLHSYNYNTASPTSS